MPIHLNELDVVPEVEGLDSALIVACNMCAGASLAMSENKPFLQFFRSLLKSPPLERYIGKLKSQLSEKGVKTKSLRAALFNNFSCACGHHDNAINLKNVQKNTKP